MDQVELQEIIISVVAIAFAFSVGQMRGGIANVATPTFWLLFTMTLVTVGLGFVLHELSHRYVARSYGAYAVYRAWPFGLMLMMALAIFGSPILFAAPGAVYIYSQYISRKENGMISIAGPLTNIGLGLVFAMLAFIIPASPDPLVGLARMAFMIGFRVNAFLALFNMIPVFPLDGSKVFEWNRAFWASVFLVCLVLTFAPVPFNIE